MALKKRNFSYIEYGIILLCLLLLFSSYYGLKNVDEFLASREGGTKRQVVGQIQNLKNDTRFRYADSHVWFGAKKNQNVHAGDSLYTGDKSFSLVQLQSGGEVTVGEKSIVVFKNVDEISIPDLAFGNFSVSTNGKTKVSLAGEVFEVNGRNAKLQIVIGENRKAQVRLLAGEAEMKSSKGVTQKIEKQNFSRIQQKESVSLTMQELNATFNPQILDHNWKLYDWYDIKNEVELIRKPTPEKTLKTYTVQWEKLKPNVTGRKGETLIQLSKKIDFIESENYSSNSHQFTFSQLNVGMNYWRISQDAGASWSRPQSFKVNASLMKGAAPVITNQNENVALLGASTTFDLNVRAPPQTIGYVAEASYTADFKPETTKAFWQAGPELTVSFYKEGTYFYRFRTVLKDQNLSDWSEVRRFRVYKPEAPIAPQLARLSGQKGYVGQPFQGQFKTAGVATEIQILNQKKQVVHKQRGLSFQWKAEQPGEYKIVARSYNEFGQKSALSKPVPLTVLKSPNLNLAKKIRRQKRVVAAVDEAEATNKIDLDGLRPLGTINDGYNKSQFSVHGLLWTLQSSEQVSAEAERAVAGGLGLRGLYWLNKKSGLEGLLKSQVFDVGSKTKSSIQSLEGRYHYRYETPLPISFLPRMQISAFVGAEAYKNSSSLYNSQYEVFKFGTSLAFPLARNWATGGEFVYGQSSDSSSKSEISGFISRFFSREWSFGVGYRVTFFEAGSASSSPAGTLPYREGYTEGYSALYYHF
jgi:hypothetical protein